MGPRELRFFSVCNRIAASSFHYVLPDLSEIILSRSRVLSLRTVIGTDHLSSGFGLFATTLSAALSLGGRQIFSKKIHLQISA